MAKTKENITFEESLSKLRSIVDKLENEEINIDESISLYEEGLVSYYKCMEKMDELEGTIKVLVEKNNDFIKEDF